VPPYYLLYPGVSFSTKGIFFFVLFQCELFGH
jgi:hypothetical protein